MTKILVAYFSASGVTAGLAKRLAECAGADLFEIEPAEKYTAADLKWTNPLARCNREKFGKKDVPVKGRAENMADYGLVLVGFPIWYGAAPNVVNTFLRGYDFTGKRVAAFATSGGSPIGKTAEKLRPYVKGGEVADAKLFSPGTDEGTLKAWVETLV